MSTITTRAGKGSPLTNGEVDDNFTNLNADKLEAADLVAADTSYDNTDSGLTATNVKSAIDELQDKKLNVSALSASVVFYPTDSASDVSTYYKLVTSTDATDYDATAVDISTGSITASNQFVAALASDAGVLEGSTGTINIHTVGNVRKTAGQQDGTFYFEVYLRNSSDVETLLGTSGTTGVVSSSSYEQFFAEAQIESTAFTSTDRVVIKYYGNPVNVGTAPTFDFQFGGTDPVRTNFPVPVTVVPHANNADEILVDTTNFAGLLSGSDDHVQTALETLDDHTHTDKQDIAGSSVNTITGDTFDCSLGNSFYKSMSANWSPTFTNVPSSGTLYTAILQLDNGGSYTITWSTAINWVAPDGTTTTSLATAGVTLNTGSYSDWILLWTEDGGTTWFGKVMR